MSWSSSNSDSSSDTRPGGGASERLTPGRFRLNRGRNTNTATTAPITIRTSCSVIRRYSARLAGQRRKQEQRQANRPENGKWEEGNPNARDIEGIGAHEQHAHRLKNGARRRATRHCVREVFTMRTVVLANLRRQQLCGSGWPLRLK